MLPPKAQLGEPYFRAHGPSVTCRCVSWDAIVSELAVNYSKTAAHLSKCNKI